MEEYKFTTNMKYYVGYIKQERFKVWILVSFGVKAINLKILGGIFL